MTNAELIKALRYCGNFEDREGCDEECPYFYDKDCPNRIMCDAADALEAAEKRIAELMPKEGVWIEVLKWILVGTAGALALCLVVWCVAHLIDNIRLLFLP